MHFKVDIRDGFKPRMFGLYFWNGKEWEWFETDDITVEQDIISVNIPDRVKKTFNIKKPREGVITFNNLNNKEGYIDVTDI